MDHYNIMANADSVAEIKSSPQLTSGDKTLLNTKALPGHAKTYELEKFEKKVLIIFNQLTIQGNQRHGTEKDVAALNRTFSECGFEVKEYLDFTKEEIEDTLKAFSRTNFTDYGCVAVAVLTHGADNGLLRAKDQWYSEEVIKYYLKAVINPTLYTKPKIIIIQACRGSTDASVITMLEEGRVLPRHSYNTATHRRDFDASYDLPAESDMLILHSCSSGNLSFRDMDHGSWFIQELCDKINYLAEIEDLESILIEVKKGVAINKQFMEYNRKTFVMDIYKQMPVITSTLIRKLYLRKFGCATVVWPPSDSCMIVESRESVSEKATRERKAYQQFSYMKNLIIGRRTFM